MIIQGFTLQHARIVASCASSSVKSHVSSNKATPRKGRVVPKPLTSRFSCCILDCGFRFGHITSILLSMTRRNWRGTEKKPSGMLEKLCHLFSRLHFLSRHKSKGRNLVLRALSCFLNQLEADLLVHAFHLPLHVQKHGVSSSPMGTMFASAPAKLPQSTSRTSHPSRLNPVVVLHVEHSQKRAPLRRGLHHHAPVSVWTKGVVRSRPVASLWT